MLKFFTKKPATVELHPINKQLTQHGYQQVDVSKHDEEMFSQLEVIEHVDHITRIAYGFFQPGKKQLKSLFLINNAIAHKPRPTDVAVSYYAALEVLVDHGIELGDIQVNGYTVKWIADTPVTIDAVWLTVIAPYDNVVRHLTVEVIDGYDPLPVLKRLLAEYPDHIVFRNQTKDGLKEIIKEHNQAAIKLALKQLCQKQGDTTPTIEFAPMGVVHKIQCPNFSLGVKDLMLGNCSQYTSEVIGAFTFIRDFRMGLADTKVSLGPGVISKFVLKAIESKVQERLHEEQGEEPNDVC